MSNIVSNSMGCYLRNVILQVRASSSLDSGRSLDEFNHMQTRKLMCIVKLRYQGRRVEREAISCLIFCKSLQNGKRYSVDTDMVVCTILISISLSRLKNSKNSFHFLTKSMSVSSRQRVKRQGLTSIHLRSPCKSGRLGSP